MKVTYATIPTVVDLTRESAWRKEDDRSRIFSVVRWHFAIRQQQLEGAPKLGERVGGVYGAGADFTYTKQLEELDLEKSLVQSAVENELLRSLSQEIAADAMLGTGKVTARTRATVQRRMKRSFSRSFEFSASTKFTETIGTEIKNISQPKALVKRYIRCKTVAFLAFIDYLVVEYHAAPFAIRIKRRKRPEPGANVLKFNVPILAFDHWRLYPGIAWVSEDDYLEEVHEPYAIQVVDASAELPGYVAFPARTSLHRISNATFPLKWSRRSGPWTEEALMRIEEEEYKNRMEIRWRGFRRPRSG